jgi:hypothetical protein
MAIRNQFKVEFRKHFVVFCILMLINAACSLYFSFNSQENLAFSSLLISMIIGVLLPIYMFVDYYQEFFIGKMIINHTLPIKTSELFMVKSIVFIIGSMMVWSGSLFEVFLNPQGLYHMRMEESGSILLGVTYLLVSKLAGTICGLAIMGFSIATSKQLHIRSMGNVVISVVMLICIGFLIAFIISETTHWSIGTSSLQSFKQYAGPLTISNVYDDSVTDINLTIRWMSVVRNVLITLVAGIGASLLFNSRKYEIYGK